MTIPRWLGRFACAATAAFWLFGVAVPLAVVLVRATSGSGSGGARLASEGAVFWDPDVRSVAWFTARQAWVSSLLSAVVGLPLGLLAARASRRVSRFMDTLLLLPQGVPTVVAATAWVAWLGRSGPLGRLDLGYSLGAVILAHVFYNAPWVALLVAQARRSVPQTQLDAAASLGAGNWARFRLVTWPGVRWALGAACTQTLAVCSMSFALVLILGGGPPVETLETALYSRLRGGALDLSGAAACAVWELLLTLLPWLLLLWARGRARLGTGGVPAEQREDVHLKSRWAFGALVISFALFIPYLKIFSGARSCFSPGFWTEAASPLLLSLKIAASASVGTLLAAASAIIANAYAPARLRTLVSGALALPSGLSVLVLGLGAWLAYGRWIDPFEGSLAAIVGIQIVVIFPLVFRLLWPVAQAASKPQLEAAWTLGASPWRAFGSVEWPRWRGPVFSALALAAGLALGEVAAVSLFYSEKLIPLPLLVARWMSQYRFEDAQAVSALLLVASVVSMSVVSIVGRMEGGPNAV